MNEPPTKDVLPKGTRIGPAVLGEPIAEGPSGYSYAAEADDGGRLVVKECGGGPEIYEFVRRLNRDDLPAVRDLVDHDGTTYAVVDWRPGEALSDLLAEDPPPNIGESALADILTRLSTALEALHSEGWLHRDVSPSNVLIAAGGSVVLIDLGAAARIGSAEATSDVTPGYAAPEQYVTEGNEGPWTDVYGLGAVGWRILTGEPLPEVTARVSNDIDISATLGSGPIAELIAAAVALDPKGRPQSMQEFRDRLTSAGTTSSGDGEPGATVRVTRRPAGGDLPDAVTRTKSQFRTDRGGKAEKPRGSGRKGWAIAASILVLVLAGGGYAGWTWYEEATRTEWRVDASGTGHATTIADALKRARAGATVTVAPGTYRETLVVDRVVQIVGGGTDPSDVVIAPLSGACAAVSSDAATIRNVSFQGAPNGRDACLDIASGQALVEAVEVASVDGPAMRMAGNAAPTLRRASFKADNAPAVLIEGDATGSVTESRIVGGKYSAVIVRGSATPVFSAARIESAGQAGILFLGPSGGRVADTVIENSGGPGIEIRGGADPEIAGSTIRGGSQSGIYVHDGGKGRIRSNTIVENAHSGVVVGAGSVPSVNDNIVRGNGEHGVLVLSGGAGSVRGNTIEDNKGHGLALADKIDATVEDNRLSGNKRPERRKGRIEDR